MSSGFPGYLDYRDAFDHFAAPQAVKSDPIPVVIIAQLNQLADQAFQPRATVKWNENSSKTQFVVRPTAGGGVLVEMLSWELGAGTSELSIFSSALATVIPNVDVDVLQTGGPTTSFLVGLRQFEAIQGIGFGRNGEHDQPIYVAPGDILVAGRTNATATSFEGRAIIKEIPVAPIGI